MVLNKPCHAITIYKDMNSVGGGRLVIWDEVLKQAILKELSIYRFGKPSS